jgi:hypothetical protein
MMLRRNQTCSRELAIIICIPAILGCQSQTELEAELSQALDHHIGVGTERVTIPVCSDIARAVTQTYYPELYCENAAARNELEKILIEGLADEGVLSKGEIRFYEEGVLQSRFAAYNLTISPDVENSTSEHLSIDRSKVPETVTVDIYQFRFGKITEVIEAPSESDCDIQVKFTHEQFGFAPWGEAYLARSGKTSPFRACLVKKNDDWLVTRISL